MFADLIVILFAALLAWCLYPLKYTRGSRIVRVVDVFLLLVAAGAGFDMLMRLTSN